MDDTASREYEQQEIVRSLVARVHQSAPTGHIPVCADLAKILIDRIADQPGAPYTASLAQALFQDVIEPAVAGFTQEPAERIYLYARLMERVTESLSAHATRGWLIIEIQRSS